MEVTREDINRWNRIKVTPTITDTGGATSRGDFICHLIKKNGWTTGAELGIWKGATFLKVLKECPDMTLIGVDLWAPQPENDGPENWIDWNHTAFENHVRASSLKFGKRAIIHKMTTIEAADLVENNSLDFIFIDADHSSKGVENDIVNWRPKIKENGYIMGHDINWPTVRCVVESYFPDYFIGPYNVWFSVNNP